MSEINFDWEAQQDYEAVVEEGTLLYRVASAGFAEIDQLLTPSWRGRGPGRWHRGGKDQAAYASNSVLIAICEVLYHMRRTMLERLVEDVPTKKILSCRSRTAVLAAMRMKEIDDLIFVDAKNIRTDFGPRLCGTALVTTEKLDPLWDFGIALSSVHKKRGVVYPSARHHTPSPKDVAVAFFEDESKAIEDVSALLSVRLKLISEDQSLKTKPPRAVHPFDEKVHQTTGYYEFDKKDFLKAKKSGLIRPLGIPHSGYVEFTRKPSNSPKEYPECVVE